MKDVQRKRLMKYMETLKHIRKKNKCYNLHFEVALSNAQLDYLQK